MKQLLFIVFLLRISSLQAQPFQVSDLKTHISFLASDDLEGRGTGSLGEIRAANYIAALFKSYGLQPAGKDGSYFQTFESKISVETIPHTVTARNVIGFLDNGAEQTIVVGAHYDHLGKGFQGSSLSPDSKNQIHNGADDNASGTSGVLELAKYYAGNGVNEKHNFLFIAFSGEELGLIGSKYFTSMPTKPLSSLVAMINMDMIGRLDDAKGLVVSGWGTSPLWGKIVPPAAKKYNIAVTADSSGVGASDHTSFYLKDIPVLQFFSGGHGDYHKISDDADKINYEGVARVLGAVATVINSLDAEPGKPMFTQAGNAHKAATTSTFKVTLGVMPDYTFSGKGLRVDGVSQGRPAAVAGIQTGDIIIKLAGKDIGTIYDYMEVLGAHEKGEVVEAQYVRKGQKQTVTVRF
ncbi:M28 family peptidase [Dyadobacter helix]|nr:M28 family peptidase [Dyadobacter sp. CECT 9275]